MSKRRQFNAFMPQTFVSVSYVPDTVLIAGMTTKIVSVLAHTYVTSC